MKKLKFINRMLLLLFLAGAACACSDDNSLPEPDSGITDPSLRVSELHLSAAGIESWSEAAEAGFDFIDPENRRTFSFGGSISHDPTKMLRGQKGAAICRIATGATSIPDGKYFLIVKGSGIPQLGTRMVEFKGNKGTEADYEPVTYDDLEGEGTESNPYLINDAGDFLSLLWYLEDDATHACGLYFRQTASFEVPRRSQIIDGHVWAPVTFSGNYNGGGCELKALTYQGASDPTADCGIGLFRELYSATVSNLKMTDVLLLSAHSSVGIIAGETSGNTTLSNIAVSGTITADGDNIGALVGYAYGDLSVDRITVSSLAISANESQSTSVGGLIGFFTGGSLSVTDVSTPDHIFSVTGFQNIGGIVGHINEVPAGKTVKFSGITLEHSVDQESSSTKVIYGDGYVGGIAGRIREADDIRFSNLTLKCPVRGNQDIGGVAGHIIYANQVQVETTVLSSVVKGGVTAGGFFGYLQFGNSSGALTFAGSDNTTRYVVKSSAAADVEGERHVGGLIGYLDANHGKIDFKSKVEIAVNVTATEQVGGAVGYARDIDGFNLSGINFSSTTMKVSASTSAAGGIFGKATSCNVSGPISLSLTSAIPSADNLTSCFSGVVTGGNEIGGIAGHLTGTITGAGCNASVTANAGAAGGICGYFDGTVSQSAFFGTVSATYYAGGIFGLSEGGVTATDCLNLANISGGVIQGGIGAYSSASIGVSIKFENCFNRGNLSGAKCAAGIAGEIKKPASLKDNDNVHILTCGNSGNISGTGDSSKSIAGIVGAVFYNHTRIYYCANHGNISSSGVQMVIGGVAGELGFSSDYNWTFVSECMNSGTISCSVSSTKLGGVVGHLHYTNLANQAIIRDCLNIGDIPSDQKDDTGGILGYTTTRNDIHRTFNRGKISHGNAIIGTHKSGTIFYHSHNYYLAGTGGSWPSSTSVKESDIAKESVYGDFDFSTVWKMTSDGPTLRRCPFINVK